MAPLKHVRSSVRIGLWGLLLCIHAHWHCVATSTESRFVLGTCDPGDYEHAQMICMGSGGTIPMPKTVALENEARAVFNVCPARNIYINGQMFGYRAYWVGARCLDQNSALWLDDTPINAYCANFGIHSSSPFIFSNKINTDIPSFLSPYEHVLQAGVVCERPLCPSNCRPDTTTLSYTYQQPSCCVCDGNLKAIGPRCQCAIGSGAGDCDPQGTDQVTYEGSACKCICKTSHTGDRCENRLCTKALDCTAAATSSATGIAPACTCTCLPQYTGSRCEQRYCSIETDCTAVTTALITGIAPGCTCTCLPQYTGSRCEQRYCTKEQDCTAASTVSVSGIAPACSCTCLPQYTGSRCETRICHVNYDCQGRGISIEGQYPSCICMCAKGSGGRNCRLLTRTSELTISQTLLATISLLRLHTNTYSVSFTHSIVTTITDSVSQRSLSNSHSSSPTASPSLSLSATFSVSTSPTKSKSRTPTATLVATAKEVPYCMSLANIISPL